MRADKFFSTRFGSRTKAAEALKAGLVRLRDRPVAPDDEITGEEPFLILSRREEFVSEGGYKLAKGLDAFERSVEGMVFADLGASTGGFTDCLLQRGAKRVFCVDVGKSQLAPALSSDPRVTVMDDTNARYLSAGDFSCPLDGIVGDLSFISLRLILPTVVRLLPEGGCAYVLFKPQFECGRQALGKSGICPFPLHRRLLGDFYDFCLALQAAPVALTNAPIRPKKNIEYLLWLQKGGVAADRETFLHPLTLIK